MAVHPEEDEHDQLDRDDDCERLDEEPFVLDGDTVVEAQPEREVPRRGDQGSVHRPPATPG